MASVCLTSRLIDLEYFRTRVFILVHGPCEKFFVPIQAKSCVMIQYGARNGIVMVKSQLHYANWSIVSP